MNGETIGTVRHIGRDETLRATQLVKSGAVVPLGRVLDESTNRPGEKKAFALRVLPMYASLFATDASGPLVGFHDEIAMSIHTPYVTHLDAIDHIVASSADEADRRRLEANQDERALAGKDVLELASGIVTRGVLLDMTAVRGVPWLAEDDAITPADLEAAERLAKVTVGKGDALIVYVGFEAYDRSGQATGDTEIRCGVAPSSVDWLLEREIGLWSGECVDKLPTDDPDCRWPIHEKGMAKKGLVLIDNPTLEGLIEMCRAEERYEFLYVCAGLRIRGGTGSAVNPLAVF